MGISRCVGRVMEKHKKNRWEDVKTAEVFCARGEKRFF